MEGPLNRTIQVLLTNSVRSYINEQTQNLLANATATNQSESSLALHENGPLLAPIGYQIAANLSASERLEAADLIDAQVQSQLEQSMDFSDWERVFWIILFFSMVLVATSGNIIVIYIVGTNKEMKSVTNYFLVNLSFADTMVSMLNVTFNFISMLMSEWPFGLIYCKISNFIAILSISASIFTLTAISCDRYNAILHPLRPRMSHRNALGWIALIWTISVILALPNAIFSQLTNAGPGDQFATTCTMLWPDGRFPNSIYEFKYNIIIMVLTYIVPIITMAILYYQVGRELWGYQVIGEHGDLQQRALLAKKKIVKMMIVVVIIFALCWLPYQAFFILNYYLPSLAQDGGLQYQRYYLIIYWLAMSNSMYNPIIIYFMNSKFRHEILKCLCFLFCCKKPHRNQQNQHQQHQQQQYHTGQTQSLAPSPSLNLQHGRNGKSGASNATHSPATSTINGNSKSNSNGKPLALADERVRIKLMCNDDNNQDSKLMDNFRLDISSKCNHQRQRQLARPLGPSAEWDQQTSSTTTNSSTTSKQRQRQFGCEDKDSALMINQNDDNRECQPFLGTSNDKISRRKQTTATTKSSGGSKASESIATSDSGLHEASTGDCADLSWI